MLFAECPSQSPQVRQLSCSPEREDTTGKEAGVAGGTLWQVFIALRCNDTWPCGEGVRKTSMALFLSDLLKDALRS